MSVITYTAKRAIATSHALGGLYTIELLPRKLTSTRKTERNESRSLSGVTQNTIYRRDMYWSVTTDEMDEGTEEYEQFLEFMESVDEFEPFIFYPEGSLTSLGSGYECVLTDNYSKTRIAWLNRHKFSFMLRYTL